MSNSTEQAGISIQGDIMDELKPCPFCGTPNPIWPTPRSNGAYWQIVCGAEGCGASLTDDTEGQCIAAWNNRAAQKPNDEEKGTADIKQAAKWMEEGKSVRRARWAQMSVPDGTILVSSLQADHDEGLVLFRFGGRVLDMGQITTEALLAEDWELAD